MSFLRHPDPEQKVTAKNEPILIHREAVAEITKQLTDNVVTSVSF